MVIAKANETAVVVRATIHGFQEHFLLPRIPGLLKEKCILKSSEYAKAIIFLHSNDFSLKFIISLYYILQHLNIFNAI